MPIKDPSAYPDDWEDISDGIRARAHDRCEQCGVENGALIHRLKSDLGQYVTAREYQRLPESKQAYYRSQVIRVVLTVAHLDNDTANNRGDNLRCLCQLHHLRLDASFHAQNAAKTRAAKKRQQALDNGQQELFP